jgi:alpha-L-fucosidase
MLESDDRLTWWRQARFGLMIHWGLYSLPAGEWRGQRMEYIGEWLQSRFRIPRAEYEALAPQFNPTAFDAEAWVSLAKRAGMGYLVITAKHHDGFAMYHSKVDPYNIVDATPFGRDPLAELAEACARHGLKLGLYYSQALDWHEPDGGGAEGGHSNHGMSWTNDWDYPDNQAKRFERYFERKALPQVRELLTGYGALGAIWFDTPFTITRAQSQTLYDLVRELQPDCLVNSRLGNGLGDYGSLGDNSFPAGAVAGDWEVPATLNDTWGYKHFDHNWKSAGDVVRVLGRLAGLGVNYLLNVGPTAEGLFPAASVDILEAVGAWMAAHREAVIAAQPTPLAVDPPSGPVTWRPGRVYLHLHRWPGRTVTLAGLDSPVRSARLLGADEPLPLRQADWVEVELPDPPAAEPAPVLVLAIDGDPQVATEPVVAPAGATRLGAHLARRDGTMTVDNRGIVSGWRAPGGALTWNFQAAAGGRVNVKLVTQALWHNGAWSGGHQVAVSLAGQRLAATVTPDEPSADVTARCYAQAATRLGAVTLPGPGRYELELTLESVADEGRTGLVVTAVELEWERLA